MSTAPRRWNGAITLVLSLVRRSLVHSWNGVVHMGMYMTTLPPFSFSVDHAREDPAPEDPPAGAAASAPPPGHPERLLPGVPPGPEESRLWEDLADLRSRPADPFP